MAHDLPLGSSAHAEYLYRLAVEEAEELSIDLDVWRTRERPGSSHAWCAAASWPREKEARRLWIAGHPDYLEEPPPALEHVGFGATAAEAAWTAVEKICDEG